MSKTDIPKSVRRFTKSRAVGACEYCLINEDDVLVSHEIDHIIAEQHGGQTVESNLAYAFYSENSGKL